MVFYDNLDNAKYVDDGGAIKYVYMMIPRDFVDTYHTLLAALADFGKTIINKCGNKNNDNIINCWNLFQSAVACYNLAGLDENGNVNITTEYYKKATLFKEYIDKQLETIYNINDKDIYRGALPMYIDENGKLIAIVTRNNKGVEFKVNPSTGELIQNKQDDYINYSINNDELIANT